MDETKPSSPPESTATDEKPAKPPLEIPKGESNPAEGTITMDEKSGFFADLAAYHSMEKQATTIADEISEALQNSTNPRILMVDSLDFCGDDILVPQVMQQLDNYIKELKEQDAANNELLKTKARSTAFTGTATTLAFVSGTLSALAEIFGFFKVDLEIKGREVKLSDSALRSKVAHALMATESNADVFLQNFYRLKEDQIPVVGKVNEALVKRRAVVMNSAQLKVQVIDKATARLKTNSKRLAETKALTPSDEFPKEKIAENLAKVEKLIDDDTAIKEIAEAAHVRSEALVADFDVFNKLLMDTPEGKSQSLFAKVAMRQGIDALKVTHLLYATVAFGAGESIVAKGSLWRGQKINYQGGGAFTYFLIDAETARIAASNTLLGVSYAQQNPRKAAKPTFI